MSSPDPSGATPATPQPVLAGLRCIDCGYDLTGLHEIEGARCPECGAPLCRSIRGSFLSQSDPITVARYADAAALVIVGVAADLGGFASFLLGPNAYAAGYYLFEGASLMAWFVASWRLGAPVHPDEAEQFGVRGALRLTASTLTVITFAWLLGQAEWWATTPLVSSFAEAAWAFLVYERFRQFGFWAADARMSRYARPLALLAAAIMIAPAIIALTGAGDRWAATDTALTRPGRVYYAIAAGGAALMIMYLARCRRSLEAAARAPRL